MPLQISRSPTRIPVLQGYKNSTGIGYHVNFADPLPFANHRHHRRVLPRPATCRGDERAHVEITGDYLGWRGSLVVEPLGFLRPVRTDEAQPQGLAAKIGYDDLPDLRRASQADAESTTRVLRQDRHAAECTERQHPVHAARDGEVGLHYTDVRHSLGAVDDEKGLAWDSCQGQPRQRRAPGAGARRRSTTAFALPLRAFFAVAAQRGRRRSGDRDNSVANFYFGGFGNNYVDSGVESSATATTTRCRASASTRSAGRISSRQMVEWNLPPVDLRIGWHARFYLNWLRPAVFVTGLWTDPRNSRRGATTTRASARRPT